VIVFALVLVVLALAPVYPFLLELAGLLLGVMRELPAPLRRALALKIFNRFNRFIVTAVTLLFAVRPGTVGVVACLPVVELALFAVATSLVGVEQGLVAVELPLLCVTVANLAHRSVSSKQCGLFAC
jgi:hypothetical protein